MVALQPIKRFFLYARGWRGISSEIENILGLTENRKKQPNHSLNTPALEGQEKAIEKLHKILKQCRIFYSEELHMFKLMSKEIVPVLWIDRICGDTNLWEK